MSRPATQPETAALPRLSRPPTAGAALEYGLFRRIASDVAGAGAERLPAFMRRLPAQHPLFLIGGRLVPFGNHAVNAVAGSHRVPLWRFTWTSALAFLPFSAFIAAIANGFVRP